MYINQKLNTLEIQVLLSALNIITIKGSYAKTVANLQIKLEDSQKDIAKKIEVEEEKKEKSFQEMKKG